MKRLGLFLGALALLALPPALAARSAAPPVPRASSGGQPAAPEEPDANALRAQVESIEARLHPQTGDIRLPGASAILHLGRDYYFLPAAEARIVVTEGWGNPPDSAPGMLGMVFPAGAHFYDEDSWGAVITYEATGYVNDDDAQTADYAALLQQLQAGEAELNQQRTTQGYPTQHLVGWAQQPAYDRNTHSVIWARNLQISGSPENTLNYDVRLLGRNGVLSLNMVTGMSQLAATRQAAQRFGAQAEFTAGSRYADHQSGDRVAEYGVAGLVAAGVGATVLSKTGMFAVILLFLKKIGIFIVAGIALLWGGIRRLFGGRGKGEESYYYEAPPPAESAAPATAAEAAPAPGTDPPPPERSG